MSELPLGKIIDTDQQRDAIHIAVAPVVASHALSPGEHIGFVTAGDTETVGRADGPFGERSITPIGIVDPFLTVRVIKGDRFWMFLYPQTITSLRHDWTHPAFVAQPIKAVSDKDASEAWLRNFCATADGPSYEAVMAAISGGAPSTVDDIYGGWGYMNSEYLHFDGRDAHGDIPDEFWHHAEIVLGEKLTQKPTSFSCSC